MLFLFLFPLVPAALVIAVIRGLARLKMSMVINEPVEHEYIIYSILFLIEYLWNLLLCYGIMKMTGAL
jgi:hypothetical protein